MVECNVDWRTVSKPISERMAGWFAQHQIALSHNQLISPKLSKPFQSGGFVTIATNLVAGRAIQSGSDFR